ncbi:MAG: hypothetical protein CL678_05845 [Bdellovibrionaceae bacterium]|nr:hypothetical protein [Pseudobdellovibrionaceae bacterium]|tara:strand:- start:2174 stop:3388 length:1215 start_codon:yes stop_codon:yes gene_type:complete
MIDLKRVTFFSFFLMAVIIGFGTLRAFQNLGPDFFVFFKAGEHVLTNHSHWIYQDSPDRFLYAPGFAWLMSGFALLSREMGLAIWCLLKAFGWGLFVKKASENLKFFGQPAWVPASLALVFFARPLIIDFQYGQINSFIVIVGFLTLLNRIKSNESTQSSFLYWFLFSILAFSKLFPLPMILVPLMATSGLPPKRVQAERLGVLLGLIFIGGLPFLFEGRNALDLYFQWFVALKSKGLPIETHNQSFIAFLIRFFTDVKTPVIAMGGKNIGLGYEWLSLKTVQLIGSIFSVLVSGLIVYWVGVFKKKSPWIWMTVLLALLIVPSHLIWKPYFIFGIPIAALAIKNTLEDWSSGWFDVVLLFLVFFSINFTSFDFVGMNLYLYLEASSIFLFSYLVLVVRTIQKN